MVPDWTPERLMAFTERVRIAFLEKRIHAPVHLPSCEAESIEAFKAIRPQDYVCSTYRSMHHALLKGCDPEWVFAEILAGRSMGLFSKEHRLLCSAIVGGMLPIAAGLALGAQMKGLDERVHVFLGDMGARCGLFFDFLQFCDGHKLPVRVCVEDNGYSTDTPTEAAWGSSFEFLADHVEVVRYKYTRRFPHVGLLEHVTF